MKKDGSLTYRRERNRFKFNEKVFKLNSPHFREVRKEYFYFLEILEKMNKRLCIAKKSNDTKTIEDLQNNFVRMKEICSKRLIFYELFNVKIPGKIKKLLTNKTKAEFII